MKLPIWQLDAFASARFAGNPAAVVPVPHWLPDATLQAIAAENNVSETAYVLRDDGRYHIRWFTPTTEVPLCGHATLAAGWVVLNKLEPQRDAVTFGSKSGPLTVARQGERLAVDLPANGFADAGRPDELAAALGQAPQAVLRGEQWLAAYPSEDEVRALEPDFAALKKLGMFGVIVTAPGSDCDFVSRFFAPAAGIPEDPVTGAAHTRLVPYWARRLGRTTLRARQVSARGGELWCELKGERVVLGGHAAPYLEGSIEV